MHIQPIMKKYHIVENVSRRSTLCQLQTCIKLSIKKVNYFQMHRTNGLLNFLRVDQTENIGWIKQKIALEVTMQLYYSIGYTSLGNLFTRHGVFVVYKVLIKQVVWTKFLKQSRRTVKITLKRSRLQDYPLQLSILTLSVIRTN